MDGNNSLKRIHSAARGHVELPDSRHILSDRWLSAAQVNKFSNEVKGDAVPCGSYGPDTIFRVVPILIEQRAA